MTDSILDTIKQMLGIPSSDTAFDLDIITSINGSFMILHQLGVGPEEVFTISDKTAEWNDFLDEPSAYALVQTYIYLRVKMVFDPPGTSFHLDAISQQILELGWRLNMQVPIPPES